MKQTKVVNTKISFSNFPPTLWAQEKDYIVQAKVADCKTILNWAEAKRKGATLQATYEDATGKCFAWQIRFPLSLYDHIARFLGLPKRVKRQKTEKQKEAMKLHGFQKCAPKTPHSATKQGKNACQGTIAKQDVSIQVKSPPTAKGGKKCSK